MLEQTIGELTIPKSGPSFEGGGQLPIIATVYSMSTGEGTEDPMGEEVPVMELVSTVR